MKARAEFTLCYLQSSRQLPYIGHMTHMNLANPTHAEANLQGVLFGDSSMSFFSGCEGKSGFLDSVRIDKISLHLADSNNLMNRRF